MALNQLFLSTPFAHARFAPTPTPTLAPLKCLRQFRCLSNALTSESITVNRRSGNYHSSVWDDKYLQSLTSDYAENTYTGEHVKLKDDVKRLLKQAIDSTVQLELISDIQRLGVGYHFEEEIKEILDTMPFNMKDNGIGEDLYSVALCFRLLREHGYEVSQDVFKAFMDKTCGFTPSLCGDAKGLLSLYEASHLSFQGETILDMAKLFAMEHLKNSKGFIDKGLAKQVEHSLELPLHWRTQRLEARWYIEEVYETKEDMNPILLGLAKLDYNMVQAIYQGDVKNLSRWWRNLGLGDKLPYTRDRLVECFLWGLGIMSHPQFRHCRKELAKVNQLITTVDDIYDVYGTLDELELFTDSIERWDTDAMRQLPEYMKICYLAVYNTVNKLGYENLKEQGVDIIPCLKRGWADLCKAYLIEAKWYHSGYKPTLDEYLNNARISISGHVVYAHGYYSMKQKITMEGLQCFENKTDPLSSSLTNFRLTDDWGTSVDELARGDVLKSIQCYMHEKGVSEVIAREHIKGLIGETWKKMNEDQVAPSPFPKPLMKILVDTVRISHCFYLNSDGFGASDGETKDHLMKLIVEPIPLNKL